MQINSSNKINILDLSFNGKLDPINARFFNKISDQILKEYVESINALSSKQVENVNWFLTPFFGRNTFICNVFEEVSKIIFIKTVFESGEKIDKIIVETPVLKKILKSFIPKKIKVVSKQSYFKYYLIILFEIINGLIKFIISSWLRLISFRLVSLFFKNKSYIKDTKKPFSIIETYIYKNSFQNGRFTDRHFCNLEDYLDDDKLSKILYIPTFYRYKNYFVGYLNSFKSSRNFLFIEEFLSIKDLIYPIIHPFKLKFNQSDVVIRDIDFSTLVNHSLVRHSTNTSSLYAILKYRFCNNLRKNKLFNIERVIRWYENQEVDRGTILGWRLYSSSIEIVGYMGYFAPKNYLSTFPIQIEYETKLVPDTIGVMGPGLIKQHKQFCDSLKIKVAPSFRFALPNKFKRRSILRKKEIKVLVTCPVQKRHIQILVNIINEMSSKTHEMPIKFLIKPHPVSKFTAKEYFSGVDNSTYDFTDESIPEIFKDIDIVMSFSSSTLVEAVIHNIYSVLVSPTQMIRLNVIPKFVPNSIWNEIYTAEELSEIINQKKYLTDSDLNDAHCINGNLIGMEPNTKNVSEFLGL